MEKHPVSHLQKVNWIFQKIDFTRIYKSSTTRVVKENGMDYVEPIAYTEEESQQT